MMKIKVPKNVSFGYRTIKTPYGRHIRLLVVRPKEMTKKTAGVLWLHGGGYATGFPEMVFTSRAIDLVSRCGALVAAPAYTLSPAAPYPAAVRDCHSALVYMKDHSEELGIRSDQIMVGGESAGGGLCAAVCMYAKDHDTVNVAFQMPLYPMLDCFDTPTSANNHCKVWNTSKNHLAWRVYLRGLKGRKIPCYASPSRRKNYRGLPPCYTFVGDIEPFCHETLEYVRRLKEAGVEAHADVYEGFYHAYDMMEDNEAARHAADVFVERFEEACEKYRAPQKNKKRGK
ncbi:MAG: alpha/beta hydrolase [Oscillospiraceae bacterium]